MAEFGSSVSRSIAWFAPVDRSCHSWGPMWRALERSFGRFSRSGARSVAALLALSLSASVAIALYRGIPEPAIHDEFSYLLAADTFLHGRLTNPPHPLWPYFETIHVIQHPTYASKYPPAQGLVLAAGWRLAGHPIAGIWLITAAACAAVYWALGAYLPPRWALLGGLIVTVHPLTLKWSQGYWGGSLAMLGGALLLGSFGRLTAIPRWRDALWLGIGVSILANSRPYEGLVLSLFVGGTLGLRILRSRPAATPAVSLKILSPAVAVLAFTAGAMAFYDYRVTGNPFELPYQVDYEANTVAPLFLWQHPRYVPVYLHPEIRRFHTGRELSLAGYPEIDEPSRVEPAALHRSAKTIVFDRLRKASLLLRRALMHYALAIPLIALPWVVRRSSMRAPAIWLGGVCVGLFFETFILDHYAAPVAAVLILLLVQSLRQLRLWRWKGRAVGESASRFALGLWAFAAVVHFAAVATMPLPRFSLDRAHLLRQLNAGMDRHLVIVRYRPKHNAECEWVYNEADIDSAKVVWAREMSPARDQRLIDAFKDRRAWLLEADEKPARLSPYLMSSSHESSN